jgi:hypothetical protein
MEPVTIICDACGQTAYVQRVRYKYRAEGDGLRPAEEHVLVEIQRDVECPTCGERTQIEQDGKP